MKNALSTRILPLSKQIEDLIDDLVDVLENGTEVSDDIADKYGKLFSQMLKDRLKAREPQERGTLRMSNIGKPCERQLWYDVNNPSAKEEIRAHTKLKFLYGDVTELLMLALVEASGHSVEGTQDTQEIAGIKGHRDCVIDGMVVDVKSTSSLSFKKFENGTLANNDPFGYVTQIQSYVAAAKDDPLVTRKNEGAFLVMDKTLGHFCLDIHQREDIDYKTLYQHKKDMVDFEVPPERTYVDIPEGASGNMKLPMACSYCSHKNECWDNLRTFIYAKGPTYFTSIVREPNVPELKRED